MRIEPLLLLLAGCQLGPQVGDEPQVSLHILPAGSVVPDVADDPELVHQILVHDGLDDGDFEEAGGVVPRLEGWSGGQPVYYWGFGNATRLAAMAYILVDGDQPVAGHPWLLDGMAGDPGYSAIRRLQYVQITDAYDGEIIASLEALSDAVELGLVEEPVAAGTWIDAPVVAPGTTLEIGLYDPPAEPEVAYARGYRVPQFRFGGELGVQPLRNGSPPMAQLSRLRVGTSAGLTPEPIFQMAIPTELPTDAYNYTPLSTVVEVRLATGVTADLVTSDADLFRRGMTGSISAYTAMVDSFTITTTILNWPMQFAEGAP
jgi:hypothetical protein